MEDTDFDIHLLLGATLVGFVVMLGALACDGALDYADCDPPLEAYTTEQVQPVVTAHVASPRSSTRRSDAMVDLERW